jgi:hypothetical protein
MKNHIFIANSRRHLNLQKRQVVNFYCIRFNPQEPLYLVNIKEGVTLQLAKTKKALKYQDYSISEIFRIVLHFYLVC